MNNGMKKFIFLIVFINVFLSIFANGTPDRDRQSFGSIQIKIVNLTNDTIKFYLNRLYAPREIKSQEEYITEKMLVSHTITPLFVGVPSFIGIQYNNNENIIVYRFRHRISEMIFVSNNQYIVVIKDSGINFIEGNIDDTYDFFDESLYQSWPNLDWLRESLGEKIVELMIENNSGSEKTIWIYTVIESLRTIIIQDGMTEKYTIDDRVFSIGDMRIQVVENGWTTDHILLSNLPRRTSILNYQPINIKLKLNSNGYEISYY
jgi:gamma-glutamylcyclotransferase (GGCT)/AIG2-like uncharacterized protein YtfP